MKSGPKISVVMCVYNDEKYVAEAIESILNQTFKDFEFIILNDGSTDKTQQIIDSFKDRRIIRIKNEKNLKLTRSLNKVLMRARGDFIAIQDSDDISRVDRLEKEIKVLEEGSEDVAVVSSFYIRINEKGKKYHNKAPLEFNALKNKFLSFSPIHHSSVLIRKKALEDVGLYNEKYKESQDHELWFRLLKKYKFKIVPEELLIARTTGRTKERVQIYYGIKARLWALKNLDYPFYYCFYLIKPVLDLILPKFLKRPIQYYIIKSR
ncbi:MAG: glycosyltransferase [Nanoarchaeota archaeon]